MANVLIDENTMKAIGDSIRGKNGTSDIYLPSEMPAAIDAISGGSEPLNISDLCGDDYSTRYGSFCIVKPNDAFYKALLESVSFSGVGGVFYPYPPSSVVNANKDIAYHFYDKSYNPQYSHSFSIYVTNGSSQNLAGASSLEYMPKAIVHGTNINRISLSGSHMLASSLFNHIKEFDYHDFYECVDSPDAIPEWSSGSSCFQQSTVKKVVLPERGTSDWGNTFKQCYSLEEIYFGIGDVPGYATPDYCSFSNTFQNLPSCHTIEITGAGGFYNDNSSCTIDLTTVGFGYNGHDNSVRDKADSVYSRTQFINTINKLFPSQSTGTIKVAAGAGANNADGGMDALTASEIAIATDKGWTVTIS